MRYEQSAKVMAIGLDELNLPETATADEARMALLKWKPRKQEHSNAYDMADIVIVGTHVLKNRWGHVAPSNLNWPTPFLPATLPKGESMNEQKAREVAAWLRAMGPDQIRDVTPVRVLIRYAGRPTRPGQSGRAKSDQTFYGARYTWVGRYEAGMMACTHGDKKPGEEYTESKFYLLGNLPRTYRYKVREGGFWAQGVVYREPGSDFDWYVSGYWDGNLERRFGVTPEDIARHHPFGIHFMLWMWDHVRLKEPIDRYSDKKADRAELIVTVLDDAVPTENADAEKAKTT